MTKIEGIEFHPVYCCDTFLCEAMSGTSVKCMICGRWQNIPGDSDKYNRLEGATVAST